MRRAALLALCVALSASPAYALDEPAATSKATGLHIREPLTTREALHAAAISGYGEVYGYQRLSGTAVRLTVCGGSWDIYKNDVYVGRACGNTLTVTVRLRHNRVDVFRHGRALPSPD